MKSKIILPILIIGLTAIIVLLALGGQSKETGPDFTRDDELRAAIIGYIELQYSGNWHEFAELVTSIHTILNDTLGWQGIPNITVLNKVSKLIDDLEPLIDNIGYEPLAEDLNELVAIVRRLPAKERTQSWLDAHRIIHDLDYFVINPDRPAQVRDYWGVTKTIPALRESSGGQH
ncbi:hypothetical protein HYG86_14070 [Alkalicella caledoniensis]|uniref:Uncharacterized protein n=1 Tax=Alkalicella caledoniensis TaxID=2731377 RepID=A0A7G9WAU8_ALKCA|nr:hypothetical protein [Alkalicella caledoniensis]QNO15810.1 hypothetical protein HYG86_14070 [Alkalicella caledoniensis]